MSELSKMESVDEVAPVIEGSFERPVMIFKHSLTCPISTMAYQEFQKFLAARSSDDSVAYRLIEIQRARPVSNEVAQQTGVRHESPQALLLRKGEVVWHDSHGSIRVDALEKAVAAVA